MVQDCCCLACPDQQAAQNEFQINVEPCQNPEECKFVGRKILVCLPCPEKLSQTPQKTVAPTCEVTVCLDPKTNTIIPLVQRERPGAKRKEYLYRCESRELRSGNLYQCQCIKRNGLQDDCPRTPCQGRSACKEKPWPDCWPSGGCNGLDCNKVKNYTHSPTIRLQRFDNKICCT